MSWLDTIADYGSQAYNAVESWSWTEDEEAKPKSYQQQAQAEKLAEGSALPKVETATDATGKTVVVSAPSPLAGYTPLMIGGGVLVVVLAVVMLMMKGGK